MMYYLQTLKLLLPGVLIVLCSACSSTASKGPVSESEYRELSSAAEEALAQFRNPDLDLSDYFQSAHGYAVYPTVLRLGFGAGGAIGSGFLFEQEELVGQSQVWQFMYGLVAGGQVYSQIVFFKNKESLDQFKSGSFEFVGHAGVAVLQYGASSLPAFSSDVALFSLTKFGLIVELTPGGMGFSFAPLQIKNQRD